MHLIIKYHAPARPVASAAARDPLIQTARIQTKSFDIKRVKIFTFQLCGHSAWLFEDVAAVYAHSLIDSNGMNNLQSQRHIHCFAMWKTTSTLKLQSAN